MQTIALEKRLHLINNKSLVDDNVYGTFLLQFLVVRT